MDPNGLRFWHLADDAQWLRWGDPPGAHYDSERRTLGLASERAEPAWPDDPGEAESRLARVPQSGDRFGTRGLWDPVSGEIRAAGAGGGSVALFSATSAKASLPLVAVGD